MKHFYALTVLAILLPALSFAQSFGYGNSELPGEYHSGGCVGVNDMDNDGNDDIILLDGSNNLKIIYQTADGFEEVVYGQVSGAGQWGMTIGDCNNDGHNDVFCGGAYDGVHLIKIDAPGVFEQVELPNGSMFMQACNMADIDNDGWLDIFACHDDGTSRMWRNDQIGQLVNNAALIDLESYDHPNYLDTDHSGNYGTVWTDFDDDGDLDLFLAKCRQFVSDPQDPRRINQLWINDGNNNYTEAAAERGLVFFEQSWTGDFADIDNDGDLDCLVTNHSTTLKMMQNDGYGYFTDVTEASGLDFEGFFLQAKLEDLDNDGYVDLLFSGGVHGYYHNNGDGSFSEMTGTFPNGDTMHSFSIGDLNKDGFLDVYASYGNVYIGSDSNNEDIFWTNNTNDNNWISFDLEGIFSNKNAVGAKVKIYGDWGVQVREVRAGESYGINNSFHCHFGLGSATSVDMVEIAWPAGTTTTIENPDINTFHGVVEAPCQINDVAITANGSTSLCPGESVMIDGPEGLIYDWSNGAETQSIEVTESGNYSLIVYNTDGCAGVSNSITINVITPSVPTIEVSGELELCEGESTTLIASNGTSFSWSSGEDTQSITVDESGEFSVNVVDQCESALSSDVVIINFYEVPATPVIADVSIDNPGVATFTGTSETLVWYDSEISTVPLAEGAVFETPFLESSTIFWVEDVLEHGGELSMGGRFDNDGDGQYHDSNGFWLVFDAFEDMVVTSVKVFANGAGSRSIAVVDNLGNTVAEGAFEVPDGESRVELNFEVPAGTGYGLRAISNDPQLWRNAPTAEMAYPYGLGDLGAIVSSSVTGNNTYNYYYFFYDWEVSTSITACASERIMVTATVVGIDEIAELNGLKVYPNPANSVLNIQLDMAVAEQVNIEIVNLLGKTVEKVQISTNSGQNNLELNVSNLAAGVYQLNAIINGKRATTTLVVEK
jgi:hypothetical protein